MDGPLLKSLTERGGLFFESRLGDLARAEQSGNLSPDRAWDQVAGSDAKGRLLSLAMDGMGASTDALESLATLLRNLENRQVRMGLDHAQTGQLFLHLPLPWAQGEKESWLRWQIDPHTRGMGADPEVGATGAGFRFALDLDQLGTVRVSGSFDPESVYFRVLLEKPDHFDMVRSQLLTVFPTAPESSPSQQGLPRVEFSVGLWRDVPLAEIDHFTHLEKPFPQGGSGLLLNDQG